MNLKKNIVLILCDQLRKDCISSYGNPYIRTPHIDALANEGVRYEKCYVTNPLCMASRVSIFSGMYPRNHGLWANGVLAKDEGMTLPHHLISYGYQTANIGKMHFEPTGDQTGELSTEAKVHWNKDAWHQIKPSYWGFEHIKSTIGHSIVTGNYREWFLEKGGVDEMFQVDYDGEHTGGMHMPAELHCSNYVGEMARDYILSQRDKDKPFFLTVSFPDPHFPFTPPKERIEERPVKMPIGDVSDLENRNIRYRQHYDGSWDRDGVGEAKTPEGISKALTKKRIAYSYDMIELVDENIGKVIEAIKEEGLYEETIFVFISDHGELMGDHGLWFKGPFLYEGVINVPFIIVDHEKRGKVENRLVQTIDMMPTVCDLVGVPTPHYVDGISLKDETKVRKNCLVEYRNGYGKEDFSVYAMVNEKYKLIHYDNGEYELTDLGKDPEERCNVARAEAYSEIAWNMTSAMLNEIMRTSTNRFIQICGN